MSSKVAILGCRGCRRRFAFRFDENRLDGHRLAFVCPKCGRPSAMRSRPETDPRRLLPSPGTLQGIAATSAVAQVASFSFPEILHAPGCVILARLLRREARLGMIAALAGVEKMEVELERAQARTGNRRYFLAGVAKDAGAPFWRALIELPGRTARLEFFRAQYEAARPLLTEAMPGADRLIATLPETLQVVLSGEILGRTPLASEISRLSVALCAHALAREVFWAAYLEESMLVPEVEEIFAQARTSQEGVRDLESAFAELRTALDARCRELLAAEPDAASELRVRLKDESEDLPETALAYEPD